jgi:hypothetical protein
MFATHCNVSSWLLLVVVSRLLQAFLNEAVDASTEGLIVKTLGDTYEPSRRSSHWLKLKKDYLAGVGDTFDVVPIGAFYGRGKRAGECVGLVTLRPAALGAGRLWVFTFEVAAGSGGPLSVVLLLHIYLPVHVVECFVDSSVCGACLLTVYGDGACCILCCSASLWASRWLLNGIPMRLE